MKTKLFTALLLVLTLTLLCAGTALASSGEFGDGFTWTLQQVSETDTGLVLTISGNGPMPEMGESFPWSESKSDVCRVVIGTGVTTVADQAFTGMTNLTTVTLPEGITSIGSKAFQTCMNLSSINLPTGLKSIGGNAFWWTSLETLTLPDGVETLGDYAFASNDLMEKITVPASVTTIGEGVFSGCEKLLSAGPIGSGASIEFGWTDAIPDNAFKNSYIQSVILPATITSIGSRAFYSSKLASISLPQSLTTLGSEAFFGTLLQKITIPSGVKTIPYQAFREAEKLVTVTLSEGVETIESNAFAFCTALTTVNLPSTLKTIGDYAFSRCSALDRVNYGGTDDSWNTAWNKLHFDGAVVYCEYIGKETGEDGLTWTLDKSGNFTLWGEGTMQEHEAAEYPWASSKNSIKKMVVKAGVETIAANAFANAENLETIRFEGPVTVDASAFAGTELEAVFFNGLRSEWANIDVFPFERVYYYSGFREDILYKDGIPYSGMKNGLMYKEGLPFTGLLNETIYIDGAAQEKNGWAEDPTTGKRYYYKDGAMVHGWLTLDEGCYWFDEEGVMITGLADLDGDGKSGLRCFDENGAMFTGTGLKTIGDKRYYFEEGVARTGLVVIEGETYGFGEDGGMLSGGWHAVGEGEYYFDAEGVMADGWTKIDGKWHYIEDGCDEKKSCWANISGKWYYFDANGARKTGWLKLSGKSYYLNSKGVRQTGWLKLSGKWYYLDAEGVRQSGFVKVGSKTYYLDANGVMKTGWVKNSGKWYYFDQYGVMKTGWLKLSGKWYYLDPETGVMVTNAVVDGWKLNKYGVGSKIQ